MALPTFDEFRDRLCNECDCTYEERRVDLGQGTLVTAGIFKRKGKVATFGRDNIGYVMDAESIGSICGRLGGIDVNAMSGLAVANGSAPDWPPCGLGQL